MRPFKLRLRLQTIALDQKKLDFNSMRFAALVIVVVLASCAQIEPREFQGPNGKTAYYMRCSGAGRTMDACYKKAGELCPTGYNIIERGSDLVAVPVNGGTMATSRRSLAIECK